ncbi:permease-like cell division protein FtsX [Actinoplanes sp. URMC 104]|uniref:permease-like cell division protein FtsX n=1 Tax=Actinoplanes sp. URMC 104 TaxID=3423409 RepID=UPI003F1D734C
MRRLLTAVLSLLVMLGLAGCGLFRDSEQEELEKVLDSDVGFAVFLRDDVTEQQKAAVEAHLRGLPDVAEVTYESSAEAYEKFKKLWADNPEFVEKLTPTSLPQSFKVRMADAKAARHVRDTGQAAIEGLPGVQDVVMQCMTVEECRNLVKPST